MPSLDWKGVDITLPDASTWTDALSQFKTRVISLIADLAIYPQRSTSWLLVEILPTFHRSGSDNLTSCETAWCLGQEMIADADRPVTPQD